MRPVRVPGFARAPAAMYTVPYLPTIHGHHLTGEMLRIVNDAVLAFGRASFIRDEHELAELMGIDAEMARGVLGVLQELEFIGHMPTAGEA